VLLQLHDVLESVSIADRRVIIVNGEFPGVDVGRSSDLLPLPAHRFPHPDVTVGTELFSQSGNHQCSQRRVSFDRFMLGVLKQIVWKIKSRLSCHLTNGHDTLIKALKQY
jgi:hypothetical protein